MPLNLSGLQEEGDGIPKTRRCEGRLRIKDNTGQGAYLEMVVVSLYHLQATEERKADLRNGSMAPS